MHQIQLYIIIVALSRFGNFYNLNELCNRITSDTVLGYVLWLKELGTNSDISVNTNLRGIRAFLYYAMEKGYVQPFKIRLIKAVKPIKHIYTEDELEKLLKRPNMKNFAELRTWAMINHFLATGSRLETVAKLAIGDINFENHEIALLNTKNKRQYFIPLSHDLSQVLAEYLSYRKGTKEDTLFCDSYGRPMKKRAIQQSIQDYNLSKGVKTSGVHRFRHTFAKLWIVNDGDPFELMYILGHSTLEMVKEYVAMFSDDLQKGFNSHNPLDCFNRKRHQKGKRIQIST